MADLAGLAGGLEPAAAEDRQVGRALHRRVIGANLRLGSAEGASRLARYAADESQLGSLRELALESLARYTDPPPRDLTMGFYRPRPVADPEILRAVLRREGRAIADSSLAARYLEIASEVGELPYEDSKLVELALDADQTAAMRVASLKGLGARLRPGGGGGPRGPRGGGGSSGGRRLRGPHGGSRAARRSGRRGRRRRARHRDGLRTRAGREAACLAAARGESGSTQRRRDPRRTRRLGSGRSRGGCRVGRDHGRSGSERRLGIADEGATSAPATVRAGRRGTPLGVGGRGCRSGGARSSRRPGIASAATGAGADTGPESARRSPA